MRKFILSALTPLLLLLAFASCEYKELCYDHPHNNGKVSIFVDWKYAAEKPTGMTVIFYPEDGGDPIINHTNQVDHVDIDVPDGQYDILLFNQTVGEYESISFHDMNSFDDAYVELGDAPKPAWNDRTDNYSLEPAELLADNKQNFGVVAYRLENLHDKPQVINLQPHPILVRTDINIEVIGIQYARQVRGVIAGMAKRFFLSRNATGSELTNFTLPDWSINLNEGESEYGEGHGTFSTSFISFGLPNTQYDETDLLRSVPYGNTRASVNLVTPVNLDVDVLLVDNETIIKKSWMVNDRISIKLDQLLLDLNIGLPLGDGSQDPDTDTPLVLPFVKDPERAGNGFSISVDDWGEEEIHDIEIPDK